MNTSGMSAAAVTAVTAVTAAAAGDASATLGARPALAAQVGTPA